MFIIYVVYVFLFQDIKYIYILVQWKDHWAGSQLYLVLALSLTKWDMAPLEFRFLIYKMRKS